MKNSVQTILLVVEDILENQYGIKKTDCIAEKDGIKAVESYLFDEKFNATEWSCLGYKCGKPMSTDYLTFTNNEHGHPVSIYASAPGVAPSPVSVSNYQYNDGKLIEMETHYTMEGIDQVVKNIFGYDDHSRLSRVVAYKMANEDNLDHAYTIGVHYDPYSNIDMISIAIATEDNDVELVSVSMHWKDRFPFSIRIRFAESGETVNIDITPARVIGSPNLKQYEAKYEWGGFKVVTGYAVKKEVE